ncbi:hypothetical protein ACJ5H2_21745 (plasmid) [Nocardioides sp. R1-1]|uniref:hypothetical protein n=1 Tax=Nocardioides sp. R1-1 TaxID=3383502 RepID=UPI0038CFF1D6
MSEDPTGPAAATGPSPGEGSPWADDPGYPHRIENHVKVYLHLEDSPAQTVVAAQDTAPAGTRVFRGDGAGEAQFGTVTGWTTDGTGIFVSFDQGGAYAGPTCRSVFVADSGEGRSEAHASRWVVSDVTVDGYPLDGVEDGHYCDYEGHPPGARPDWDRQHREAADVHLPTAEELLPLLATALGRSIDGPTVDQLRAASDLLAEHAEWRAERADLSAAEEAGRYVAGDDWHDSDDAGCDLADRAIALLAEMTGQTSPTGATTPAQSSGVSLMRSTINAAAGTSSQQPRPESISPSQQPPSGPARSPAAFSVVRRTPPDEQTSPPQAEGVLMTGEESRFTDPVAAVDHVRRVARETAAEPGYQAAASAVMDLRREYRIMPLRRNETPPDRLATWDAARLETRSLVPMALGGTTEHTLFDERASTPAEEPLPQQPGWAPVPSAALQAAALHSPTAPAPTRPPVTSHSPAVDQAPSR